jgi:hypothetical protein
MKRISSALLPLAAAAIVASGCGLEHSSSVLVPTAIDSNTKAAVNTANSSAAPSLLGAWTSGSVPSASSCGNFQYEIATQTPASIAGTFSAVCGGGITLNGNATGEISGTSVALTATGTATMPNAPACPFTLSGTGTIEDNGYTLRIPFSGTTCLGPVSGTEVMRRPRPQSEAGTLAEPTPVSPSANAHIDTRHPRLTVTNAARTGSIGPVVDYQFDLARDEAFTNTVGSWNVTEQATQTSLEVPAELEYAGVYYWRARATDGTSGPWSRVFAFQAPSAPQAAPPPPVASGQDAINLHQVIVTGGSPRDVASWPVTASLNALDFQASGVAVQFSKKDGSGRWPDVLPPGWDGMLQYTLWMVVNVNGQWYTSGGVEYWYGLGRNGGPPSEFARNWYYSQAVWGALATRQPNVGEQVGFFVTAGDARAKDVRAVSERSNVVMVPFPSNAGAYYPF